jgi:hypothetical protein
LFGYRNLLEQIDKQENNTETKGYSRDEFNERLVKIQKRVTELEKVAEIVDEKGTIYLTDPDARLMRTYNGGGDISHNVQTAVEEKNHFVVAVDAVNEAVDYAQLHNIAVKAKEELDVDELISIADKGYYSGEQFAKCKADGIKPIAPHPEKGGAQERGYTKGFFRYDKDHDCYTCPNGSILTQPVHRRANRKWDRYYNPAACAICPMKEKCTPKTKYRTIIRGEYDNFSDEADEFTKQNLELYAKRKCMVEHPFGTIKRSLGYTYFLTRGTENVKTESFLHFMAYNLKRLIDIVGVKELKIRLQS